MDITKVHKSWDDLFEDNNVLLNNIFDIIDKEEFITPQRKDIFKVFELPVKQIKIIIIGQDPYPQPNVATGRAFEVKTLKSWSAKFRNSSLKNILRSIYFAYHNKHLKYKQILAEIEDNNFKILPPDLIFDSWQNQGVFLLNSALTTVLNKPSYHIELWKPFLGKILEFVNYHNHSVVWLIWGNYAKKLIKTQSLSISDDLICFNNHPMICSKKNNNDFLFGRVNPFAKTKYLVKWLGY